MNVSREDVLDMDLEEAQWFAERIGEERKVEAQAIKAQSRRGRS